MPITTVFAPDARMVAPIAFQAGFGQYVERLRNAQQQERMQANQINASERMAQFQAGQRANEILWNANNADVMANRDANRRMQLGEHQAGLQSQQFGQESGFRADEAQKQRQFQESMAIADDERQRAMQAEQLRNQSPLIRQLRDLDASEAEMHKRIAAGDFEETAMPEFQENLNNQRMKLLGALKQPTPEEQADLRDQKLRAEVPNYDRWIASGATITRDEKGVPKITLPPKFDSTPEGVQKKLDADLQKARIQADNAAAVRQASQHQRQIDAYDRALAAAQASAAKATDDAGNPVAFDQARFDRDFDARQAAIQRRFGGPQRLGTDMGPLAINRGDDGLPPQARKLLEDNRQDAPIPVSDPREIAAMPEGTVVQVGDQLFAVPPRNPGIVFPNHAPAPSASSHSSW